MRKFFIFNVNKEMAILTKNSPYSLYKSMEQIYNMKKNDLQIGLNIYDQIIMPINFQKLDKELFEYFKDNDHYSKFQNQHYIHNKYRPEDTTLTIHNSFLVLESNALKPVFLKCLTTKNDFLACDFENRDYFWLEELRI